MEGFGTLEVHLDRLLQSFPSSSQTSKWATAQAARKASLQRIKCSATACHAGNEVASKLLLDASGYEPKRTITISAFGST